MLKKTADLGDDATPYDVRSVLHSCNVFSSVHTVNILSQHRRGNILSQVNKLSQHGQPVPVFVFRPQDFSNVIVTQVCLPFKIKR